MGCLPVSDCIVETIDGVRVIRFNRPERLNALGGTLMDELNEAIDSGRDDDRVKAFVVTGEGRGWSAGADLAGDTAGGAIPNPRAMKLDPIGYHGRTVLNIFGANKPTIAAVNGVTVGGGFGFCSAFDIRIASDQARFSTVFIRRALAPDCGLSWFLPRLVGPEKAAELFFTGRMVDAEEALRLGIVSKVVPHERLMDEAMALARQFAKHPPAALAYTRKALQNSMSATLDSHLEYEWTNQRLCTSSAEFQEGVAAFREKREPDYTRF
jgi:2-(1,2-epoxy-1,2-dihydrophenyl)acetyl-CoA isomerase